MSKISDETSKADIIARRGAGETFQSIADDYGVCKQTVHAMCANHPDEIRKIKEELWSENIENIVSTVKIDLKNSKTISENFEDTGKISAAEVAYKTSTNKVAHNLLQEKGIFPSPAFMNVSIDQSKHVNIDPEMFKLLSDSFDPGFVDMSPQKLVEAEVKDA